MEGMENAAIICVMAILVILGIIYGLKHFRRQGGCCGSGSYKLKRKRLPKVLYVKKFRVEGMHCANCKQRVEEAINDIRGAAARADLKKGEVTVSYAEVIPDEAIRAKVERAGYKLLS